MRINEKLKKYLDLPYLLLAFGVFGLIRAFVLLDYSNFTSSSFNRFTSPVIGILTMIIIIKVLRKRKNKINEWFYQNSGIEQRNGKPKQKNYNKPRNIC